MTVEELRQALKDLPGDMVVAAYDGGGYLTTEIGVNVITADDPPSRYPEPDRPYLDIGG